MIKTLSMVSLIGVACSCAAAAVLDTIDRAGVQAELRAVDAEGVFTFIVADGQMRVPLERIVSITFRGVTAAASGPTLELADGDRLEAKLVGGDDKGVEFLSPLAGRFRLAYGRIALYTNTGALPAGEKTKTWAERIRAARGKKDVAFFAKGNSVDSLECTVEGAKGNELVVSSDLGAVRLKLDRVVGIAFARPREPVARSTNTAAMVELVDGSRLTGSPVGWDGEALVIEAPLLGEAGRRLRIAAGSVARIEVMNGLLVYLSDLVPAEVEETPYYGGDHVWRCRMDRSVWGRPLAIAKKVYRKGIGTHARARLVFDLGGRYRELRASVGIDDEVRPRGSVVFSVIGDGKTLWRSEVVSGKDEAVEVKVDVSGVARLTLLSDFADEGGWGDHGDWADARLIRGAAR
jgi:hypothetical protein